MTRWDAFTTMCAFLRAGLLGGARPPRSELAWELIIEVASFHFVSPALAWCLRDESMPPEVGEYFSSVAALNGERNERMLSGVARAAASLNEIGIEPVLLKGCAMVAEGLYPDASLRLMGDADILIPRDRAAEAVAALTAAGFATNPSDIVVPPGHHHLQMLHDRETGVGVELHTDVMGSEPGAVIATDWFCKGTRPLMFRGHRVLVPAPTPNAGHCIYHSQIFHSLHYRRKVQLRHMLDLALLRARHEAAIDWTDLDRRFSAAGHGEVLAVYLQLAEALLGQAAPALSHAPPADALSALREVESRDGFHVQIENLKGQVDAIQSELSRTMMKRDQLQAETEQLRTLEADLQARHAALQSEFSALTQARVMLEQNNEKILASRSWRWTAPLRALIAVSRGWRRQN